ncbi:MAG: endonuclease VIII [Alistipes sp.]|jgi:formamidopyrimidine-DNA glycosylase|nr:endonuclease VIII [Alistipes sp.]
MLELPETTTLAKQITRTLAGQSITGLFPATNVHKLTWFTGDPADYPALLMGRKLLRADGHGAFLDILFDDDVHLALSDGVMLRYHTPDSKIPERYQLLATLSGGGFLVCTVAMYGGIQAFRGTLDNPYYRGALTKPSPLTPDFDERLFDELFAATLRSKPTASAKAFLATEQRIPGLGNGVLQDILFVARINPRRRIATLSPDEQHTLFTSVKETLAAMTAQGGRDTERDLFGTSGGYRCLLSKATWQQPCPQCGGPITKEPYLGGAVYYCPRCQAN